MSRLCVLFSLSTLGNRCWIACDLDTEFHIAPGSEGAISSKMAVMPCCALRVWARLVLSVHSVHCFVNRCLTGLTSRDFKNLFRWSSGVSSFSFSSELSPEGRNKLHPGVSCMVWVRACDDPPTNGVL